MGSRNCPRTQHVAAKLSVICDLAGYFTVKELEQK
jgi:hypothetical protein